MPSDPLKDADPRKGPVVGRMDPAKPLTPGTDGPDAAAPSLASERTRQVLERLATDYYDRPEVLDQVAQRVAEELRRVSGT